MIDYNCLSYWYPKIHDLVPTPETRIIWVDEFAELSPKSIRAIAAMVRSAAQAWGEYPVFLRTGHTSGKHGWRATCFVADEAKVEQHIHNLVEFSAGCCLFGLPVNIWVVRRMIPTKPRLFAFDEMPVVRERRYFVSAGQWQCDHPYWPADCFVDDEGISAASQEDIDYLHEPFSDEGVRLALIAAKAASTSEADYWSVDVLEDATGGYWVTDMAQGSQSWHWQTCQFATRD